MRDHGAPWFCTVSPIFSNTYAFLSSLSNLDGVYSYGNLQMPPSALHELNISTVSKLMTWKANLPLVLQVDIDDHDSAYLPHVLLLQ